ncbi:MAG TPA: DNA polymerase I [Abditibacteriaceae bacterium]|nr:DNA polymerase I [Abditibacteriaceae bacterium]
MKLLLVDGYSLLYRAFFSSPPLTTRDGQPTGALYGFSRMLLSLLDKEKPDYALVALDATGPTFRHDSFSAYKANRPAAPDDLASQTALVRGLLEGLSIPYFELTGYEADDVLGTVANRSAGQSTDVTIVTGDGDALQLVNDHVSVLLTRRGVSDLERYTPAEVRARFGFEPPLLPDFKGLRGDTSDNIPGVPGIGDKTAMSLVSKFGSLDNLYEHLDEVTPPRIRELLIKHRDEAFHSRELARIITDMSLEVDLETCRCGEPDAAARQRALETLRSFQFTSLAARYAQEAAPATADAEEDTAAKTATFEMQLASLEEVQHWLASQPDAKSPVGLLVDEDAGIVLARGDKAFYCAGQITQLRDWLEDSTQPKVVHDFKAVQLSLRRQNMTLRGVVADTLLMGYLIEPTRQHHPVSLLVGKYLGEKLPAVEVSTPASATAKSKKAKSAQDLTVDDPTSLFGAANEDTAQDDNADEVRTGEEYSPHQYVLGATAHALCDLEPVLRAALEEIEEVKLFDEIELPLVDVLVSMEQCGMLLDPQQLRELDVKLEADAARLQREIWDLAGEEFNVGSTKQLQTILFDKMGLAKGRTTKTGHSTDVHTLEKLAEQHEIVRKILEYRGVTKLKSTYVDALLNGMEPASHRIHTNLNQTGAASGRLSSSNPNLQNVPIRTEQGRLIRKAFIAPPGHVLLKADYSQIELRILAHITGDEPLVTAFREGQDVHARTAADLFKVPVEAVDSEMRRKAKMTNYAIAYGVSGFGLAKQLGTGSPAEAQEFIKRYFETLPGVERYIADTLQGARSCGYVQTLLGRRRPVPEINAARGQDRAATERVAINHPIQGTAADIMKLAMLAIAREMHIRKLQSRMMMQVHDELVFEVPTDEVDVLASLVSRLMSQSPAPAMTLRVPLEVDIGTGPNWNDTAAWSE